MHLLARIDAQVYGQAGKGVLRFNGTIITAMVGKGHEVKSRAPAGTRHIRR